MQKDAVFVITGAYGFIASGWIGWLNRLGYENLILVDDFTITKKKNNLLGKKYIHKIQRDAFFNWWKQSHQKVDFFFHLGARTDTTETDERIFNQLNLNYSKQVWLECTQQDIPLIYASSAATYGDGAFGYKDENDLAFRLKPLNAYGRSKNDFDKWVLQQESKPPFWAGLKFFNVYGPNEYHKGRMASVILHAFRQIRENGNVRLFKSHRPDYQDGGQMRDFIYVKDIFKVLEWFMSHLSKESGLYNLGTGKARSFLDLATSVFQAMDRPMKIEFIDTPLDIRDKYQYFTQAEMNKLRGLAYDTSFFTLEEGIKDYVQYYLLNEAYL